MAKEKTTVKTASEVKPSVARHPMLEFVPTILNSFEEWFDAWQQAKRLDQKLELLHTLTTDNGWWQQPELIFTLLDTADGFTCSSNFSNEWEIDSGYGRHSSASEKRQAIAKKAFTVLCTRFFRNGRSDYDEPAWWWMLENEVLFQKVLWFLRKENGRDHLRNRVNFNRDGALEHSEAVFCNFLRRFARLGWAYSWPQDCQRWDSQVNELVKQCISAVKPQLLAILDALGELRWLDNRDLILDNDTVTMLTGIALEESLHLPDAYRKPATLAEAILGGSVAARVVVLHKIKARERKRVEAQRQVAAERRREAERFAQLERIAADRVALKKQAQALSGG